VLISYGTGAIMAVPGHDTRDFEFAQEFGVEIIPVVDPGEVKEVSRDKVLAGEEVFTEHGVAVNSGEYDGLSTGEFKTKITEDLAAKGLGQGAVNYKLRDWLFSRQHFWGEPFPILHELDADGKMTGLVRTVPPEELPVDLPVGMKFDSEHASPEPPLDAAPEDWLFVTIDGKKYKRETNSMPQWAGSCWYYLRFLDPKNTEAIIDPEIEKAWMPVDLYVGGAEHAVLHLLYARFWHKVLYDYGYVSMAEPFHKLVNQGMILGEMEFTGYQDDGDQWVSAVKVKNNAAGQQICKETSEVVTATKIGVDVVEKKGDSFVLKADHEIRVDSRAYKMSKSRGNVVNPDEVVKRYGADSLRLYEMFMGPLEAVKPWSMDGVSGVRGFLDRVWRMIVDERAETITLNKAIADVELDEQSNRVLHKTIKAVTDDLDQMAFNTALARMMEFTNYFLKQEVRPRSAMEKIVLLVAPFAPHIAEELWALLGRGNSDHGDTLAREAWPTYDEEAIREDTIEVPVQIKGKLRAKIQVAADADRETLAAAAKANPRIAELIEGKTIVKEIVVPGRLVNFVVK